MNRSATAPCNPSPTTVCPLAQSAQSMANRPSASAVSPMLGGLVEQVGQGWAFQRKKAAVAATFFNSLKKLANSLIFHCGNAH
ncbi:hypothetical protein [Vandammella animalimorsus]|uniref:hypothetical protein n=1 Tax=Vandammella animalimorsus TaxID=2029117 RepID=UPI0011C3C6DA|nr:hypothetical protein [Vandammella animalimorsus]